MDNKNRPHSREKNVTSGGKGVQRRGEGGVSGRVGSGNGGASGSGGAPTKAAAAGGGALLLIILVNIILPMLGINVSDSGGGYDGYTPADTYQPPAVTQSVNNTVAQGSRDKRVSILGGGRDTVTLMVYMCGTDLESKHGMASADMEEMRAASKSFGDNFDLLVYTGGCKEWKSGGISSKVNQIYSIKGGEITCLVKDDGSKAMTDPDTLSSFIRYCAEKYPANRYELILWDHGGGSVSGYGYDEKNSSAGSMKLAGISKALRDGGVTFDFIGFDACLMATAENALMLNNYGDYLIASEETEPGIGWYYTNWLTSFAKNTSMSTVDIGKSIIDDFVDECGRKCRGQKTTLSIIDLAEFANTVPADLSGFSKSVSSMISSDDYKTVSDARYAAREFAVSSKIDQVDLADLAQRMNTAEGKALSRSVKGAVKYNRTSSNMTNANGVSIFFPYKRTSYVDSACSTYDLIGMDPEYSECIRQFAGLETGGQIAAGGTSSPIGSLFDIGGLTGSSGSGSDVIGQLLSSFLSGTSDRSVAGLDSSNISFMDSSDSASAAEYISQHYFDTSNLIWEKNGDTYTMSLPESQWELIHAIDKNMYYYDGEGYVDLGTDNLFGFDDKGNLVADSDKDWVSINGQPVAYYHTDTIENADGSFTDMGYVPVMLNGSRMQLILVFENGGGYIAGASADYKGGETDTIAKSLTELNTGDKLDFICDFYDRSLEYRDSYYLGEQMTVTDNMLISNTAVGAGDVRIIYSFTDIYNNVYYSELK